MKREELSTKSDASVLDAETISSGREILKRSLRKRLDLIERTPLHRATSFITRAHQAAEHSRLGLQLALLELDDALDLLGEDNAKPVEIGEDGRVKTSDSP